ncbi:UNVERIFIED_CONTAM: hypothetical protein GTU68_002581 [Idotea baltica]|nr:hypothetical protein [Idotea baltica]
MKRILITVLAVLVFVSLIIKVNAQDEVPSNSGSNVEFETQKKISALGVNGGVESLRGASEISETNKAEALKRLPKDTVGLESNYVYQPPLIPHSIRHYEISLNANKCLSCHSWKNSKESGATKISVTHYQNRDSKVLSDVSPRRYFCVQCHVPQSNAKPLVGNTFKPVKSLR